MSETVETPTIDEQLHELAAPLHERFVRVERDLRVAQAVVSGLRDDRSKLRAALRVVDPTFEPENKPGPKKNRTGPTPKVTSDKTLAEMAALLEANRAELANGTGFTATALERRRDWRWSQSATSAALRTLHERGVVRLDRTGTGGSKWFVLV